MGDYTRLERCRAADSDYLISVLNLGQAELSGVFPKSVDEKVTRGPLELVLCPDSGLLQLAHTYNPAELYGANYGYRSGLNQSMVTHLEQKVRRLEGRMGLRSGDVVVDIGSNDGTLLKAYETKGLVKIGVDPTALKFMQYYPNDVIVLPAFFSAERVSALTYKSARLVTSIAMFYDLDDPVKFAQEVESILAPDGVWHFEQSYMPSMLRTCSYDTICHEHMEYYSLSVVNYILARAGMRIIDVQMNNVNGGSFAVTAAKVSNAAVVESPLVRWLLEQEQRMGLDTPAPYRAFEDRVFRHREDLRRLIDRLLHSGGRIMGYGASTKGNVLLQFCGFTYDHITAIADVNPDKFGSFTPGTHIPIVSEEEARRLKPDYFLVLPWHFREGIIRREQAFLEGGGKLIFPFPEIEIV